jgi:integral membrane protein
MAGNESRIARILRIFSEAGPMDRSAGRGLALVDSSALMPEPEGDVSKASLKHPVGWVRWTGAAEGISYLLLLGVAMPLKYLADMPLAVRIIGSAHGGLFVSLVLVTAYAWGSKALTTKDSARVMLASLLPFGPFLIDRRLAKVEAGD